MYDIERIVKIVSDIEKYFRDLEELKIDIFKRINIVKQFLEKSKDTVKVEE